MSVIMIIIFMLISVVVGFIIGFVSRRVSTASLETELAQARQKIDEYQTTVDHHIFKTHEIMSNIYKEFDKLHKHTEEYTERLNLSSDRSSVLQPAQAREYISHEDEGNTQAPPKDYADK